MTADPQDVFPALYTLAQIYFSEDWPDFYDDDPTVAVAAFMSGHPGLSNRLPIEIDALLASIADEEGLGAFFDRIQLLYDPPSMDDQHYRDWLIEVAHQARSSLQNSSDADSAGL